MKNKIERPLAVYIRVSTKKQELENQLIAIEEWLKVRGLSWEDIDYKFEDVESGAEDRRPGFQELWRLVREGRVKSIIVFEISRLSRRQRTLIDFLYDCVEKGTMIYSVKESYLSEWLKDPKGRTIIVGLLSILYDLERQLISERTKAGLARARAQGKKIGGQFKLSEKEVKELIRLYKEGVPIRRIARRFGISRATVYRYLRRAGIQLGSKGT
ncbi:MAG: hypothetical protein DRJ52_08745 [Thermoprotei archaeon]|nr:MAG: hypothetical protein DRJ52_08745 [Thermoprotei archaeon]